MAKPLLISRAEEGSGEESARASVSDFFGGNFESKRDSQTKNFYELAPQANAKDQRVQEPKGQEL